MAEELKDLMFPEGKPEPEQNKEDDYEIEM